MGIGANPGSYTEANPGSWAQELTRGHTHKLTHKFKKYNIRKLLLPHTVLQCKQYNTKRDCHFEIVTSRLPLDCQLSTIGIRGIRVPSGSPSELGVLYTSTLGVPLGIRGIRVPKNQKPLFWTSDRGGGGGGISQSACLPAGPAPLRLPAWYIPPSK